MIDFDPYSKLTDLQNQMEVSAYLRDLGAKNSRDHTFDEALFWKVDVRSALKVKRMVEKHGVPTYYCAAIKRDAGREDYSAILYYPRHKGKGACSLNLGLTNS